MHCLAVALALSLAAGSVVTSTSAQAGLLDGLKDVVVEGLKEGVKDGVKQVVTDGVKDVAKHGAEAAKKGALRFQQQRPQARQKLREPSLATGGFPHLSSR
jgi:hypothetical protein